ncbi:MAG TPA: dihydrolipoyl dehydrogenase [Acidobacteriota bacterium]|nr:dihydrolipoyl dehydrogenase [Acidobacteriota bacterium]
MDYDVCVIGAGPGGYVAAIRAAQLGQKTAIIERAKAGGICTSWGCIPSKTLLHGAGTLTAIKHAKDFGITVGDVSVDFAKLRAKKDRVINRLVKGVEFLLKNNGVTWIAGEAAFAGPDKLTITGADGTSELTAKNIIIATGARPVDLPHLKPDGTQVITYVEALEIDGPPGEFVVIGGGAIGLEMAEVYAAFGFKVTVVEMMPTVLPGFDADLCKAAADGLKKGGVTVLTGTKVSAAEKGKDGRLNLTLESTDPKAPQSLTADRVLVAVGLRPNSENLGLDVAGVAVDKRGFITVDGHMRTGIPNIFAIGDVVGKKLLAHKASREGHVAADNAAGHPATVNYRTIPGAVFLHPEIGTVGMSEHEAAEAGFDMGVGKFPLTALGRAVATGAIDGFVKVITDKATDQVVGVHIVAPTAGDMIAEAALAMEMEASAEDMASTVHVHPTFSEAMMEAAADARGEAIHIPKTS